MHCPPQDVVGSPDLPPPSQDTYSAPLWAGAVSLGSEPGQGQTVFPDLGGAVDSLALLHQSMRLWHSPLATSLKPRTYCDMCCYEGVGDLRNFPVPPELGQENVGLGGRSWECRHSEGWAQLLENPEGLHGREAIWSGAQIVKKYFEQDQGSQLPTTTVGVRPPMCPGECGTGAALLGLGGGAAWQGL